MRQNSDLEHDTANMEGSSNNKKVIVITGSIGTGKSAAVNILKNLGFTVLDSDKIVHEGYNKGTELYKKLVDLFGEDILDESGSVDRQVLGRIVFSDEKKLEALNELVHKYVRLVLEKGVSDCGDEVVFLDIPVILESIARRESFKLKYDEIWLVYVSEKTQRKRLEKRALVEGKNPEDVLKIIDRQIPIDQKVSVADEVIDNEGTLEDLEKNIVKLLTIKGIRW